MRGYFLDTSALAKLYHRESGSEMMDRIINESSSRLIISRLSIVEMESVLATKVRVREIDQVGVETGRRRLIADLRGRRLVLGPPMQSRHYQTARLLLMRFGASEGLRTLDAMQLSVALELKELGLVTLFVAADVKLCRVAGMSGFITVNPEVAGSVLI